jgi:hypothetical protein
VADGQVRARHAVSVRLTDDAGRIRTRSSFATRFDSLEELAQRAIRDALAGVDPRQSTRRAVAPDKAAAHLEPVWAALALEVDRDELAEVFAWSR